MPRWHLSRRRTRITDMRKPLYPGVDAAEAERIRRAEEVEEWRDVAADFIGNAPNYGKFKGWKPEEVLVWLNID